MNILEGVRKKHSEREKNIVADVKIRQKQNERDEPEARTMIVQVEEQKTVIRDSKYTWKSSDVSGRQ